MEGASAAAVGRAANAPAKPRRAAWHERLDVDRGVVLAVLRAGATLVQAAKLADCSKATLRKRLVEWGLEELVPPRGRRPRHAFTPEEIRQHVQAGGTLAELARLAGVSRQTLARQLRGLGGLSAVVSGRPAPPRTRRVDAPTVAAAPPPQPVALPALRRAGHGAPAWAEDFGHCDVGAGIDDPQGVACALAGRTRRRA